MRELNAVVGGPTVLLEFDCVCSRTERLIRAVESTLPDLSR